MTWKNALSAFLLIFNLFALTNIARAGHLDTLDIFSPSMQKASRCFVISPTIILFQKNHTRYCTSCMAGAAIRGLDRRSTNFDSTPTRIK